MATESAFIAWAPGVDTHSLRAGVINELLQSCGSGSNAVASRVKCGALLPFGLEVSFRDYSGYGADGRVETGWGSRINAYEEYASKAQMHSGIVPVDGWHPIPVDSLYGVAYECTVFSCIDTEALSRAVNSLGCAEDIVTVAAFDSSNPYCWIGLWKNLILRYIIADGVVIESIPDSLYDFGTDGKYLAETPAVYRDIERPWRRARYFYVDDSGRILVQGSLAHTVIPGDLKRPAAGPKVRSPAHRYFDALPGRIEKRRRQDDLIQPSRARVSTIENGWPDPAQVLDKTLNYLLKYEHHERKWIGFQSAGFDADSEMCARELAFVLFTALLAASGAEIDDIQLSQDGTGLFSLGVLYQISQGRRYGEYLCIKSAWNVQNDLKIALSTAYPSSDVTECAQPYEIPPIGYGGESCEWAELCDFAIKKASFYAKSTVSDYWSAYGYLDVSNDGSVRNASFVRWARSKDSPFGPTYRRTKNRLQYTRIRIPVGVDYRSQLVAGLRLFQAYLLLYGVDSEIHLMSD